MLNIIVLVKQVPNTTQVRVDPETNNLIREGVPSIVNPDDLHAIEAAVQIKEKWGGHITIMTMGPHQALEAVKYGIALGADEGILLSDRAFAGADTLATSYTLSVAISQLHPIDLVITGTQAADGDTAQVPAGVAEHLGIGCLTYVSSLHDINDDVVTAVRTMDGVDYTAEVPLPALLSVTPTLNEPRYPMMQDMVRAMKVPVEILTAKDMIIDDSRISLAGSPTQVVRTFSPKREKKSEMITGNPSEQCQKIILHLASMYMKENGNEFIN
jgi:electron transfer flavoprotein beta subunit